MSQPATKTYSSYYPVLAVFISLIILQSIYVGGDFDDRKQIQRAQAELAPLVGQAQKITQIVEDLGKDLLNLANTKDSEAAKIVSDLNIKLNEQAR